MVEWARAFDCRIHLNAADRQWIMRPDPAIYLWEGDTLQTVGRRHADPLRRPFRGRHGAALGGRRGGRGVVCSGDILTVATDRKWLSFMRSYPNFIPLSAREVEHIGTAMAPFAFDALYGHYFDRVIAQGRQVGAGKIDRALYRGGGGDSGGIESRDVSASSARKRGPQSPRLRMKPNQPTCVAHCTASVARVSPNARRTTITRPLPSRPCRRAA